MHLFKREFNINYSDVYIGFKAEIQLYGIFRRNCQGIKTNSKNIRDGKAEKKNIQQSNYEPEILA